MRTMQRYSGKSCATRVLVGAVAVWSLAAAHADDQGAQADGKDAAFIKQAAQGGQAEVKLGNLAAERGENAQIKELGQVLARDHSKANQELMPIAAKCGVNLPTELNSKEQSETHDLQAKTGADFDKAFAAEVIKDHEADIDKYQRALRETRDADVKVFIEKCLPVLREHLQMARIAGSAVGVDEKTLASADRYFSDQPAQLSSTGEINHNQVKRTQGVGTAPGSQTGAAIGGDVPAAPADKIATRDLKHPALADLPAAVQNTIQAEGDPQNVRDISLSTHKGQTIYTVKTLRDGKRVTLHIAEDGSLQKGHWFSRLLGR